MGLVCVLSLGVIVLLGDFVVVFCGVGKALYLYSVAYGLMMVEVVCFCFVVVSRRVVVGALVVKFVVLWCDESVSLLLLVTLILMWVVLMLVLLETEGWLFKFVFGGGGRGGSCASSGDVGSSDGVGDV